jgi:hypothetical protein
MNDKIEHSVPPTGGPRAVLTDSHFWVPFLVLIAGIALLIALHKA